MELSIKYQENYSRVELLLRTFFGFIYITFPHLFLLIFVSIWSSVLTFIAFWSILFTGRYPQSFFEFQVGLVRWNLRVNDRILNLADDYPAFGVNAQEEATTFELAYPESLSRGLLPLKFFLGVFYVALPHGIVLYLRFIWGFILFFPRFLGGTVHRKIS